MAGEAVSPACEAAFGLGGSCRRFAFAGEGPDCGGRFPVYGPLGDQHPLVRLAGEFVVDRVGDVPDDVAEAADAGLEFFRLSGDFHKGVVGIFEVVPGPAEHFLEFFGRGDVGLPSGFPVFPGSRSLAQGRDLRERDGSLTWFPVPSSGGAVVL